MKSNLVFLLVVTTFLFAQSCTRVVPATTETTVSYVTNPGFDASTPTPCAPEFTFTNHSKGIPSGALWYWNFYDGTGLINGDSIQKHTFSTAGSHKVSMSVFYQNDTIVQTNLTVTSYAPVIPMTADFIKTPLTDNNDYSFTFSGQGQNTITNYSWDFGDGKTSTVNSVANKSYTFAYLPDDHVYTVTLTITSAAGCTASVSKKIAVPGVHITGTYDYTHSSACTPPEIFTFTPKLTGVPSSAIYKWTYGDGYTESVDNSQSGIVHHQYYDAGLRSVTLSIYSKENILLYQYINPNFIQSFGQNAMPITTFSYIQDTNNTNTFHFISHSTVQDGSITILYWDFGDITSQYGADVYKSYAKTTATYPVKLTATSNAGCSSNAVVYVKVQ